MPIPVTLRSFSVRVASLVGRSFVVLALVLAGSTMATLSWFHAHDQQLYTVMSGSMEPTFHAGDVVIVERPTPKLFVPRTVISFHAPGRMDRLTTHRIVSVQNKSYGQFIQTKGDANRTPDPDLIPVGNVVGVMIGTVPTVGHWLVFYASRTGQLLIVGVPLLLLVLAQALSLARRIRRHSRHPEEDQPAGQPAGSGPDDSGRSFRSPLRVIGYTMVMVVASVATGILLGQHTNARYTDTTAISYNTISTRSFCNYRTAVAADGPTWGYRLDETTGSAATDFAGGDTGSYTGAYTLGVPGALRCNVGTGVRLGVNGMVGDTASVNLPATFTMETWFRTSTPGGRIAGLADRASGLSNTPDRFVYMTNTGTLVFAVLQTGNKKTTLTSPGSYADGNWHLLTAMASSASGQGAGMSLFVDGALVASDPTANNLKSTKAFRRVGWDGIPAGWPSVPTHTYFLGDVNEISLYPQTLTPARVAAHFAANQ